MDHSFPSHLLYLHICLCFGARNAELIKKQGKIIFKVHFDFDNSSSSVVANDIELSSQQLHPIPSEKEDIRKLTQKDPPWRKSKHYRFRQNRHSYIRQIYF